MPSPVNAVKLIAKYAPRALMAAEMWEKLPAERRERLGRVLTGLRDARSLDARIATALQQADGLLDGVGSPEEKEHALRYGHRARALQSALGMAKALTGLPRQRRMRRLRQETDELLTEMIEFLLARHDVQPVTEAGRRRLSRGDR